MDNQTVTRYLFFSRLNHNKQSSQPMANLKYFVGKVVYTILRTFNLKELSTY